MIQPMMTLQWAFAGGFFIVALATDLKHHKIPNQLSLAAMLSGFCLQGYFAGWHGLINAITGFGLALTMLFPAFYWRILGGGDVKLMMGIGALTGPQLLFWSLAYGIAAGAATSLVLILWKTGSRGLIKSLRRYYDCFYMRCYFKPDADEAAALKVPYAPALAIGWLWACAVDPEFRDLYRAWGYYFGLDVSLPGGL